MSDEVSDEVLLARTRTAVARIVRGHVAPAMVERAVLACVAGEALADRTWHAARGAGEAARRAAGRRLRERFGPRDPHRGWLNALLIPTLLAAAFALVVALGARDIADDTGASGWLGLAVAVMDAVLLAVARTRPLSGAFPRALLPAPLLLGAAAVVLAVGDLPGVAGAAGGAVVSLVTFVWVVAMRRRDPRARQEIDAAIPTAALDAAPLARDGADRVQRAVLSELGRERAAQVVRVRDAVLAESAGTHPALRDVPAGAPAGALIIGHLAAGWLPDGLAGADG